MNYSKFIISKNYKSVYYFLKDEGFSENFIKNLRKKEDFIKVNGESANTSTKIYAGDLLEINNNPNNKTETKSCILPLDIVYEDEYYLLINKESGISSMPTRSHYMFNLAGAICNYMSTKDDNFVLRMVNRLDKDTSGIIVIAKDSISQNKLTIIEKEYHAICNGKIDEEIIVNKKIKTICNNGKNEIKRIISPDGLSATTYITPIKFNNEFSLVKLILDHGRTHQIRVHLASIGHPLVGDELYGEKSYFINHTALLCKKIVFYHPFLQKELTFEVDYPNDIVSLIKKTSLN